MTEKLTYKEIYKDIFTEARGKIKPLLVEFESLLKSRTRKLEQNKQLHFMYHELAYYLQDYKNYKEFKNYPRKDIDLLLRLSSPHEDQFN
jgi:hypothetical protein